jgi:hypothetical protein
MSKFKDVSPFCSTGRTSIYQENDGLRLSEGLPSTANEMVLFYLKEGSDVLKDNDVKC